MLTEATKAHISSFNTMVAVGLRKAVSVGSIEPASWLVAKQYCTTVQLMLKISKLQNTVMQTILQ